MVLINIKQPKNPIVSSSFSRTIKLADIRIIHSEQGYINKKDSNLKNIKQSIGY